MARTGMIDDPFSRIAWGNLSKPADVEARLRRELEINLTRHGSTDDLIDRIKRITGFEAYRARRIAITEKTATVNGARLEAIEEENRNRKPGEKATKKMWVHSHYPKEPRHHHVAASGQVRYAAHYFVMGNGARLMYPGDPRAPARERINCRCYIRRVIERRAAA